VKGSRTFMPLQTGDDVLARVQGDLATLLNPLLGATLAQLVTVPASATAPGVAGMYAVSTTYLYLCVSASVWRRVAIASW